jgi:hypothetical protein
MTNPPNGLPPLAGYTPTPESLKAAEEQLAKATPEELSAAARAWVVYSRSAGGRSSTTGAELPGFYMCPTLVRAAWLAVVRDTRARAPTVAVMELPTRIPAVRPEAKASEPSPEAVALRGASEPTPGKDSLADVCRGTRDLAEAVSLLGSADTQAARTVTRLVKSLSKRLRARMNQL